MRHAILAVQNFLSDCTGLVKHGKLNLMLHFIHVELPIILGEMIKGQQRIEELEARIRELEGDRK